jgi:hypothetical protein
MAWLYVFIIVNKKLGSNRSRANSGILITIGSGLKKNIWTE